ncbi:hypothetical protein GGR58DRAFT_342699 [Xylaria digitata]|nr:hypothetical protein GGR58DRAFT_342699 [Xylaria digitata]
MYVCMYVHACGVCACVPGIIRAHPIPLTFTFLLGLFRIITSLISQEVSIPNILLQATFLHRLVQSLPPRSLTSHLLYWYITNAIDLYKYIHAHSHARTHARTRVLSPNPRGEQLPGKTATHHFEDHPNLPIITVLSHTSHHDYQGASTASRPLLHLLLQGRRLRDP